MDTKYKNIILTNHARDRAQDRSVSIDAIWKTVNAAQKQHSSNKPATKKFIRNLNGRKIHVVANYLPEKKKWLVISVWVRGEDDKPSLVWTLLTLPFKIIWWIFKKMFFGKKRK